VQNSLYVQVLRSPILAALLHGTPAAENLAGHVRSNSATTGSYFTIKAI